MRADVETDVFGRRVECVRIRNDFVVLGRCRELNFFGIRCFFDEELVFTRRRRRRRRRLWRAKEFLISRVCETLGKEQFSLHLATLRAELFHLIFFRRVLFFFYVV